MCGNVSSEGFIVKKNEQVLSSAVNQLDKLWSRQRQDHQGLLDVWTEGSPSVTFRLFPIAFC